MKDDSLAKIEKIAKPIINNLGYELVDCEFSSGEGHFTLRIYVDKEGGGVTIDDCELVSRAVEDAIEAERVVDVRYNLEVSSPGLDRPLKRREDFEKYLGREIKIKTREPIEGRSNYKGLLKNFKEEQIYVVVDGMEYQISMSLVSKARLVPDFEKVKKSN